MKKLARIVLYIVCMCMLVSCGRNHTTTENEGKELFQQGDIREFYIQSTDGVDLYARIFYKNEKSHKWVIGCHGVNSNKEELQNMAEHYMEQNYNVLLLDMRGFGKSGGSNTLGYQESKDIIQWCYFLQKQVDSSCEIYLHGLSMGAVSVIRAAADETLPAWVKACVADSAHCSVLQQYEYLCETDELKEFKTQIEEIQEEIEASGIALKDISALEAISKAKIPIYIFHGEEDLYVPVEQAYQLKEACAEKGTLKVVSDTGHVVYNTADENYWNEIYAFFKKV